MSTPSLSADAYDHVHHLELRTALRSGWRDIAASYFQATKWKAAVTVLEEAISEDV